MAATYTEVVQELDLRRTQVAGLKQQNADLLGALKKLMAVISRLDIELPIAFDIASALIEARKQARDAIEKATA